jgi:dihydroorotate dehydrogenase
VGINIGANKDSEDFVADYEKGIETFSHLASYFTVNISSPNTPGLRNLQGAEALRLLLERIFETHSRQAHQPPVFLKLAPDLDENEIDDIAGIINQSALSAVMISNTTLSRKTVIGRKNAAEAGGLSGSPVFERSTIILAKFRQKVRKNIPLIGIGGVKNGETAWAKLEAGAALVQLYSCMVYEGPNIARNICQGLVQRMEAERLKSLGDVSARKTDEWASRSLENL